MLQIIVNWLISGPVFVEFPIDTLYPYPLVKKESGLKVGFIVIQHIQSENQSMEI